MDIFQELEASEDQLVLWTSDRRLARAAEAEGIAIFDPEAETMDNLHKLLGVQ